MPLPAEVAALIETFRNNEADYTRPDFKETQLRQQFLDPLFAALGWDIANAAGYSETYKEVVLEDAIHTNTETKSADYTFRIGGTRKFLVEAKKPSVNIKDDPAPAFQLRRYLWMTKLPLGIVTNFREIAIHANHGRARSTDKPAIARLFHWRYDELAEKWDELAGLFSKEAILKGAFDKYAAAARGKRGTEDFDEAFLRDMETWRDQLARNIALRNPALGTRELNFAVQRILDRIVFLRMAEARGIEPYGQMQALLAAADARESNTVEEPPATYGEPETAASGSAEFPLGRRREAPPNPAEKNLGAPGLETAATTTLAEDPGAYGAGGGNPKSAIRNPQSLYPRLCEIFERADYRYNSGLFHFENEKARNESPDKLTLTLAVDDAVLRQIIKNLYNEDYAFRYMEAPILGSIYERFLGKTIRLTEGHRAVVDEKPEVRKAGGVYYTPDHIVDYIVRETLDPLLENKTPAQVAKLKILDPACGSGSFLVGAYQHLLDWHQHYYATHDPREWAKGKKATIYETSPNAFGIGRGNNNWQLTTDERKRILTANIHGVDIDAQAVEVTKLALLLKVLENFANETRNYYQTDYYRLLPDLGRNIQCGNTLIAPDFYHQPELPLLDDDAKYKLNPLDWRDAFPEIMKSGGFDAVIGNPPYVRIQTLQETQPDAAAYLNTRYAAAAKGNYDIYVCFIEKALNLLNAQGRTGYIVPHKFFNAEYGESLRKFLSDKKALSQIVHFGAQQVFANATTYCCLLFLTAGKNKNFAYHQVSHLGEWIESRKSEKGKIPAAEASGNAWNFAVGPNAPLVKRLKSQQLTLGRIADIYVGLQTSADDIFILQVTERLKNKIKVYSKALGKIATLEPDLLKPLVSGANVHGYPPLSTEQVILFPYEVINEKAGLIPFDQLEKKYPATAAYLLENKKTLEAREHGKFKDKDWHRFGRTQNLGIQERGKLCVPRLVDRLCATADLTGTHYLDNVDVGGLTLKPGTPDFGLKYLMGLLNSKLMGWFFPYISAPFRGGWMSANRQFLSLLPVIKPTPKQHQQMTELVEKMLSIHQRLALAKIPDDQTRLQREIKNTDRQIDALVYQLYALTPDEIALVERTTV